MTATTRLQSGFDKIVSHASKVCKIKAFDQTIGSVWDDDTALTGRIQKYSITGSLTPDATGTYFESGMTGGKISYVRTDGAYWIWQQGTPPNNGLWFMTKYKNLESGAMWGGVVDLSSDLPAFAGSETGTGITTPQDIWTSGIVLPLDHRAGTTDFLLVQEGKLAQSDQRLFISGGVRLAGSEIQVKIQLGSPSGDNYFVIPDGIINHEIAGTSIFQKAYIRRLTNGSLIRE